MASEKRSQFSFIKRNHSVRTKEKKQRDEEGALSRWIRELRGGPDPKVPALDRNNPIYHSEGKGLGSKKSGKGKRRHSFNQKPHYHAQTRCCGEKGDDEGRGSELVAMTGGSPKNHFIINPSDRALRVKGHEKGASWGGEEPQPLRQQRANSFTQQLKTVMERCEKMSPADKFLPKVDRDGKILGDSDYSIPSPPERDLSHLSHLSHLEHFGKYNETRLSQLSIDGGYDGSQTSLTRAELEQYTRAYEDVRPVSHSQQPSYAQSEGYHSYVSSADSTTTTPFLDRLRRDNIDTTGVVSGGGGGRESSASSGSSSETLKWHGSLSDVSTSGGTSTTQHIAHSARVPMPQRHHSESVLYLDPQQHQNNINNQMRRLFPVTTYEPTSPRQLIESYSPSAASRSQPKLSVAERVCEIERQSSQQSRPSHLSSQQDLDKRPSRLPDHATLKAMQKKALLSFYERHHSAWKSEPQLTTPGGPPVPPPRPQPPLPTASRRSSSASDYAGVAKRDIPRSHLDLSKVESNGIRESKHQHSSSCGSLSSVALGPMIVGPAISVDDWVPARPPKKPHLRGTTYQPPPRGAELPARGELPLRGNELPLRSAELPPRGELPLRGNELPPRSADLSVRSNELPSRGELPPRGELPLRGNELPPRSTELPSRGELPLRGNELPPRSADLSVRSNELPPRGELPLRGTELPPRRTEPSLRSTEGSPIGELPLRGSELSTRAPELTPRSLEHPRTSELSRGERPPPPRAPSPDLPPPSPPPIVEEELVYPDEPLPPPPPEEFLRPNHSSHPSKQDKVRYERAMNASMSLDNLTRSEKSLQLPKHHQDDYYENGQSEKRISLKTLDHSHKNGFMEKFNERYVENRIEAIQSQYADLLTDVWDKKSNAEGRRKPPLDPPTPLRHSLLSPPLPTKKRPHSHVPEQPRSLDSNLSIVESNNEVNKPGPQTPVTKKYPKDPPYNPKSLRESFARATSVPNDFLVKNSSERQSLRFTTAAQKLNVNGKIANAVQNGKISPTSRKANLVRTPSDVTKRVSYSHGIHHAEPLGAKPLSPLDGHKQLCTEIPSKPPPKSPPGSPPSTPPSFKSTPTLPPHCPPTTLQLSQSKASYLSYRREPKEKEKGLPNFQGSYKRTMSPNGARISDSTGCLNEISKSVDEEIKKLSLCDAEPQVEEPPSPPHRSADQEREVLSKTLPRNYSLSAAAPTAAKRAPRPPRAQSDPTSSAKVEKKSVAVSASTQDNLDDDKEEGKVILVGRSQSDRTGEARRESRMSDAASQTTPTPSPPPQAAPRRPLQEEIDCDLLSRDLASQLSPSHKLHGILVPGPEVKRTTDYVSGLFRMDYAPRSRTSIAAPTSNGDCRQEVETSSSVTAYSSDVTSRLNGTDSSPVPAPVSSMSSLQQKKQELMLRLTKKLSVLRSESVAVNEEIAVNEALGLIVTDRVEKIARPQEVAKFRLHVKEVGHITSLLLSLSGRLARAENALLTLSTNHQDRKLYEEKRDKLLCQLNEAKQLKSNIDQRSNLVSSMLYTYLTGEEYTDYDHFINMKSKLLVDSREIAEKIQLGEEQLSALKETLDQVR